MSTPNPKTPANSTPKPDLVRVPPTPMKPQPKTCENPSPARPVILQHSSPLIKGESLIHPDAEYDPERPLKDLIKYSDVM
jgi:hypothetical protein